MVTMVFILGTRRYKSTRERMENSPLRRHIVVILVPLCRVVPAS
jgi:hypothetical protein